VRSYYLGPCRKTWLSLCWTKI